MATVLPAAWHFADDASGDLVRSQKANQRRARVARQRPPLRITSYCPPSPNAPGVVSLGGVIRQVERHVTVAHSPATLSIVAPSAAHPGSTAADVPDSKDDSAHRAGRERALPLVWTAIVIGMDSTLARECREAL